MKVVLSGEGGDELFLGYPRALAIERMHKHAAESGSLFDLLVLKSPRFRGKRAASAWCARRLLLPVSYYFTQSSLAFDQTPPDAWHAARKIAGQRDPLWLDRDMYLENMLLRKTDMATMYASIEGRVPLLGAQLWNAAPSFAHENAERSGKQILRTMLLEALPRELVERPKSGFGIPINGLYKRSKLLSAAGDEAAIVLRRELELLSPYIPAPEALTSHPALSYGLVALHRSLQNLGLLT